MIEQYDFDAIVSRQGTHAAKWEAGDLLKAWGMVERFDADTIPLFVADMDFPCPQPVLDALHARIDRKILGYSLHQTSTEYLDALCGWFQRQHDWTIDPASVIQCQGVVEALDIIIRTFTAAGDGIIIQPPVYGTFASTITKHGRVVVNNTLNEQDGVYTVNFEQFEQQAADPNNTLFLLCSPHSPVGRVWTLAELTQMAEICATHDVLVVSDEVHCDLTRADQKHIPLATLVNDDLRLITCTSTNKTFNIAGLSCANIIIDDPTLRNPFSSALGISFPSPLTLTAVTAAYQHSDVWLSQVNDYLDGNLAFIETFLREKMPTVGYRVPQGGYSAWLDFGRDSAEITRHINIKANIILEDGSASGEGGAGYQRMCVACSRSVLQEALERIGRII